MPAPIGATPVAAKPSPESDAFMRVASKVRGRSRNLHVLLSWQQPAVHDDTWDNTQTHTPLSAYPLSAQQKQEI